MSISPTPLEVFYCYAHEDEALRTKLDTHLSMLKYEGLVATWHSQKIIAGEDSTETLDSYLNTASVILLLISANFLASDYCYGREMQHALQRHEAGEARVILLILRPCDWHSAPFGKLQALPSNGKPIIAWRNQDEAFLDIVKGIRQALKDVQHLSMSVPPTRTLRDFFISYTSADRSWAEWIAWQLEEAGYVTVIQAWDFRAGSNFVREMDAAAKTARRTIAILSPEYLSSNCTQSEWAAAFQRDPTGTQGLLIPVIVKPCDVSGLLGSIVYIDLVGHDGPTARNMLLAAIQSARSKPTTPPAFPGRPVQSGKEPPFPAQEALDIYQLFDLFVKSGFPHITYVEREDFGLLKLSLAQPGRGVVIEGPSGVGKTTALKKAIEELALEKPLSIDSSVLILSAREQEHQESLETLISWHNGTVIIDDFHRLDPATSKKIVDYLKYLADTEPKSKKLVIIGIPQTILAHEGGTYCCTSSLRKNQSPE